jgi:small GTP-binding protein
MTAKVEKILIVGNEAAGKTCLMQRFLNKPCELEASRPTIGVDFATLQHALPGGKGPATQLQLWDTAGQERFRVVTNVYYRGSHAALIVYDVTQRTSFEAVHMWWDECTKQAPSIRTFILVGTKCDLDTQRTVTTAEGRALATTLGMKFFETSSLTRDKSIDAILDALVQQLHASSLPRKKSHCIYDGGRQRGTISVADQEASTTSSSWWNCFFG